MTINLRIGLIIVSIVITLMIIFILRKGRMPIKYSLAWLFSSFLIFSISIFPEIFIKLSKALGFLNMSNMVIGLFIFILLIITMILTVIVSGQRKKIVLLIQELSILKEKGKNEKK